MVGYLHGFSIFGDQGLGFSQIRMQVPGFVATECVTIPVFSIFHDILVGGFQVFLLVPGIRDGAANAHVVQGGL
jgi:hypothetical protein